METTEVKLLIAVPTAGIIRHATWMDYLNSMVKPVGTLNAFVHGASPARARNDMIRAALAQNCTHILFIDDDTCPPADTIERLLSHDKDIVSGLYLQRGFPHFPLMFSQSYSDGRCLYKFLTPDVDGLVECVNTGFGCVLIKTDVFRKMESPWVTLGEGEKDHWGDDITFFNRAVKAGFKIYVDTTVKVGHLTNCMLFPVRRPEGWFTGMSTSGADMVQFPQHIPDVSMYDGDGKLKPGYESPSKPE